MIQTPLIFCLNETVPRYSKIFLGTGIGLRAGLGFPPLPDSVASEADPGYPFELRPLFAS